MSNDLVSIIIPAYNIGDQIKPCLDSCLNQSYLEIEIVVVNDGSTDHTPSIIANYENKDKRVRSITKRNEGVNLARKTGIEAANGEYLFFLDADDIITPDALASLAKSAIIENADIVAGDVILIQSGMSIRKREYSVFGQGDGISFLEFILNQRLHYLWGKLIRKSIYNTSAINFRKDLVFGEDQVQLCQLCLYTRKVVTIKQVVYHYVQHDQAVTKRKTTPEVNSSRMEILAESFWALLSKYAYNDNIKQQIHIRIIESYHHALRDTGKFVQNTQNSKKIYRQTLLKGIFGKKSLLFSHFSLILRAAFSLLFPVQLAFLRKRFK